jgi:hypothetical protein
LVKKADRLDRCCAVTTDGHEIDRQENPMSSDLVPTGSLFPSKLDRRVSKALGQIDASTTVALRQDMARLERVAQTTQHGMIAVSHLASVEAALMEATPHAAGRIHAVACAGAIQIVGIVHDAGRNS